MFGSKLTPEEKAARDARRARERAAAQAANARRAAEAAQRRKERFDAMPHFVVRETREVTVKAENMQDAIALAGAAFKEGQDSDYTIKWHKPFGIEGDTVDKIRITNVRAVEED